MKILHAKVPTPEQLLLIENPQPGVRLIRGAVGSGKTTTALLMLRQLSVFWRRRKVRQGLPETVNAIVITYNRTLKGYIEDLANTQVKKSKGFCLKVLTFGKWSKSLCQNSVIDESKSKREILRLSKHNKINLPEKVLLDEIEYIKGRFLPSKLEEYIDCKRIGRGNSPRVSRQLRTTLVQHVIKSYNEWKEDEGISDWNDLAIEVMENEDRPRYDVIIADEAQDLSANQVRSLMSCAAKPSSIVFVLDAAQRIYPRGFTWKEAGISIRPERSHKLNDNHRNTIEICKFATPLLDGLELGDDGSLPNLDSCKKSGAKPILIEARYSKQTEYVLYHISSYIDLSVESVAFLHPVGWFRYLKPELRKKGLKFVEITGRSTWPKGSENIALSTMHSAKGLEFDHVMILGLNEENTPHGDDPGDTLFENLRRMLAVAITRARKSVILGYKAGEGSSLLSLLDPATYQKKVL